MSAAVCAGMPDGITGKTSAIKITSIYIASRTNSCAPSSSAQAVAPTVHDREAAVLVMRRPVSLSNVASPSKIENTSFGRRLHDLRPVPHLRQLLPALLHDLGAPAPYPTSRALLT